MCFFSWTLVSYHFYLQYAHISMLYLFKTNASFFLLFSFFCTHVRLTFHLWGCEKKICLWRLDWGERCGIDNIFITCAWQQINQHISWMFHNKHNHINNILFNLFANKRVYLVEKYCFETHIQMYPLPFTKTYWLHHIPKMHDNKIKKVALVALVAL